MDCQKMNSSLQFLTVKLQRQQCLKWGETKAMLIVTMRATTTAKIPAMTTVTTVMNHQNPHLRRKSDVKTTTELRRWRWWHPAGWSTRTASGTL